MNDSKYVVGNSANMAVVNGPSFSSESETRAQPEVVELPPPYSQVPLSSQNPPVTQNFGQPQYIWSPQGGATFPQQQPFQYGVCPPQATAVPPGVTHTRHSTTVRQGFARNVVLIGQGYQRRSCTYRLARLGIGLLVVGITLVIVLGIFLVRPALNDTKLKPARCTVISREKGIKKSCDCGRYCTSHYPCWKIQVTYSAGGKKQTAYLYENVYNTKNKCSAQPCSSYEYSNYEKVNNFVSSFGTIDDSYTCYYNPKTPREVFKDRASKSDDKATILHSILWPVLVVVASIFLLGILFCRSKGHCCFKRAGSSVPYEGLEPRP